MRTGCTEMRPSRSETSHRARGNRRASRARPSARERDWATATACATDGRGRAAWVLARKGSLLRRHPRRETGRDDGGRAAAGERAERVLREAADGDSVDGERRDDEHREREPPVGIEERDAARDQVEHRGRQVEVAMASHPVTIALHGPSTNRAYGSRRRARWRAHRRWLGFKVCTLHPVWAVPRRAQRRGMRATRRESPPARVREVVRRTRRRRGAPRRDAGAVAWRCGRGEEQRAWRIAY